MSEPNKGMSCALGCWALAAGAGFLAFVMLLVLGDSTWMAAIFLSAVVFVVLGGLFSWLFCRTLPGPAIGADGDAKPTPAQKAAKTSTTAPAASEAKPAVASASATADAEAGAAVKPSKALSGEDELRARKGEWTYGDAAAPAAVEGAGTKPMTYDAAPDGGGDDLKKIKGIGPKLEKLCNSLGFYTFAQIAAWTPDEVAWVDQNLEGFKGRVTRDTWVAQAKRLASGEDTEFSKRVDKGGVY